MFKNIGKRIQFLAILLAILTFVGCLALAVFFLLSALDATDETLRLAGFQGTAVCTVLAFLLPLFSWVLYGFGVLIKAVEKQAENEKETKELLRHALADGGLSEDIARKLSQALAKLNVAAPAGNGRPAQPVQAARPVAQPASPAKPVRPTAPTTPAQPVQTRPVTPAPQRPAAPEAPAMQPKAPVAKPATPQTPAAQPVQPVVISDPAAQPAQPISPAETLPPTVQPLRPMGGNDQTY